MKVVAGDWDGDWPVEIKKDAAGKAMALILRKGISKPDAIAMSEVASFDIVTAENRTSVLGKVGWGAVGALALGPLGLLAGVLGGGNKKDRVMAIQFKDGRKVLIKGTAKDAEMLTIATFR